MRTVLLLLLLSIAGTASSQHILDSIHLYNYPVREGVIYKYEYKPNSSQGCATALSIVSVLTNNDSVFHFEEGQVAGVFAIDDLYAVVIRNVRDEFITYSNLESVVVKKGDQIRRGLYVGTTARSENEFFDRNQLDILVLENTRKLPYNKTIQYIRSNMSSVRPAVHTL